MAVSVLALFPVLVLSLSAFELGRAKLLHGRLRFALDAAAAASILEFDEAKVRKTIEQYLKANFPSDLKGVTLSVPSLKWSENNTRLTVTVHAVVRTTIASLFGISEFSLQVEGTAARHTGGLELVFVVDNSWYAGEDLHAAGRIKDCTSYSCNPIQQIKYAIDEIVKHLMPGGVASKNLNVAIVPYASTVNIGLWHKDWVRGLDSQDFGDSPWQGCVRSRYKHPLMPSDESPIERPFRAYYWPSTYDKLYLDEDGVPLLHRGAPVVGDNNWRKGSVTDFLNYYAGGPFQPYGPNLNCSVPITPLTSDYDDFVDRLSKMSGVANRSGTTMEAGFEGAMWVLSPNFKGLWGGGASANHPADFRSGNTRKVVMFFAVSPNEVIDWSGQVRAFPAYYIREEAFGPKKMAYLKSHADENTDTKEMLRAAEDGDFDGVFYGGKMPDEPTNSHSDYGYYGFMQEGWLGTKKATYAAERIDKRTLATCTLLKKKGVRINTFAIGSHMNSEGARVLKACASTKHGYIALERSEEFLELIHGFSATLMKARR